MYLRLSGLVLALFCVGTTELLPSGLLGDLAGGFGVSLASAGLLVTVYALTMAVAGPLVTARTTGLARRRLLLALLAVFVAGNLLTALAPTFTVLLAGRVVCAAIHGTFMAVAVVVAGTMVPADRSGTAVASMQLGINLATVLGVPLGTLVGQVADWRTTFVLIAGLSVVAVALVVATVPRRDSGPAPARTSRREWAVFADPGVTGTVLATVLCSGGMFAVITYLEPTLGQVAGFPPGAVPVILLGYGLASLGGNALGGRLADRSPRRSAIGLAVALVPVLAALALLAPSRAGVVAGIVVFAGVTFALIPGLQTRVLSAAAAAPTLALSANMSAFGLGAAAGSWVGGVVLDAGAGLRSVPLAAAGLAALGALLLVVTARRAAPGPADGTGPTDETDPTDRSEPSDRTDPVAAGVTAAPTRREEPLP